MNGGKLDGFIPTAIIQEVMKELYVPMEKLK